MIWYQRSMNHRLVVAAIAFSCGCIFGSSDSPADVDMSAPDGAVNNQPDSGPQPDSGNLCALVDCAPPQRCDPMTGACVGGCGPTETFCGTGCVSTATDALHCGDCDNDCADSAPTNARANACADSECVFECEPGFSDLDGDLGEANSNGCEVECTPTEPPEEVCDGLDNDCNGEIDDGVLVTYYVDGDEDGFGDPASATVACEDDNPEGALNGDDCDDGNADVNPIAMEVCDGVDTDCDGVNDDATRPECAHVMFVSSQTYQGNFNLTPGAIDAECANEGASLGLMPGEWRAVLFNGVPAAQRIRQIGAITLPDGTPLWDAGQMFGMPPAHSISQTATGPLGGEDPTVWTGTAADGTEGTASCNGFTTRSSNQNGTVGSAQSLANWIDDRAEECERFARVYCISGQ